MIDINLVIGYLEQHEGLIVPPNVRFGSFAEMEITAQEQSWTACPTIAKIEHTWQLIKDNIELQQLKAQLKNQFSNQSFEQRNAICPDYKLVNAGLGVYDESTNNSYKQLVIDFRTEFYRLCSLIDAASTKEELLDIVPNFPTGL